MMLTTGSMTNLAMDGEIVSSCMLTVTTWSPESAMVNFLSFVNSTKNIKLIYCSDRQRSF